MKYGTKDQEIAISTTIGASLSQSGTSGYNFFVITLSWLDSANTRRYHSYCFAKGLVTQEFCYIVSQWFEIKTSNSGNTINITLRRTNKLSSSSGVTDPYSFVLEKIQGIG